MNYPISKGTPLLKDLYKQTTHLWDMIDFDKFWFYEDEQVEYGGLENGFYYQRRTIGEWNMTQHPKESPHEKFAKNS